MNLEPSFVGKERLLPRGLRKDKPMGFAVHWIFNTIGIPCIRGADTFS
jgi:hypothetical protein